MPLITTHTRLFELLIEARQIRQYCSEAITALAAGPVSANAVVGLAQRFEAAITGILTPAQAHTGLAEYAAQQFNDPAFNLDARMAGLQALINQAINAARATIPTSDDGYLKKDIWNADGSVSVRQLSPADTATLRTALQAIYDNIPE